MKIFRKKWFWILVVILLLAGGWIFKSFQPQGPSYVTASAELGDLRQTVEVTGSVESAEAVELNFNSVGKIADILVKTGDNIVVGQLLASLVATDVSSQVADARAAIEIARSEYDQLLAGASTEDIEVTKQELASAEVAYRQAQDDQSALAKTKELTLKNLITTSVNTANNKLATAQYALDVIYDAVVDGEAVDSLLVSDSGLLDVTRSAYQVAKNDYGEALLLVDKAKQTYSYDDTVLAGEQLGKVLEKILTNINNSYNLMVAAIANNVYTTTVISNFKSSLSTQATAVATAISALQSDVATLKNDNLSYETQLVDAQNDIDAKLASLNLAKAKLGLKTAAPRDFEIKAAQAKIRRAQATLDRYLGEYNKTIISAPFAGIITDVNYKKGEQTSAGQPVITVIGLGDKEIEVDVPESDIAKVQLADEVEITLDAFSADDKFRGQVMFIDPAATSINNVIYYQVKVSLLDKNDLIKAGMTADLVIKTDERQGALIVPSRAVIYREDGKYVQLLQNGQLAEKPVETGLRGDDGMVEIISGLSAGDTVVTYINNGQK